MTEATKGPYEIWGDDEQGSGVPCIEIGCGPMPVPVAKSICLVQSTLNDETDEFEITEEDRANARLLAAAWEMRETYNAVLQLIECLLEFDPVISYKNYSWDEHDDMLALSHAEKDIRAILAKVDGKGE